MVKNSYSKKQRPNLPFRDIQKNAPSKSYNKGSKNFMRLFRLFEKKPKSREVISFSRQLATLLLAGISVTEALTVILKGFSKSALGPVIQTIKQTVERGNSLSSGFRQFPSLFNALYCGLAEVGELSGTLDTILEQISTYQEKAEALKRKIQSLLFYPCLVLVVGSLVFIYLLTMVVPTFKDLFDSLQVELPAITKGLLALSYFLNHYGLLIVEALVVSMMGMVQLYKRNRRFKIAVHRLSLKIPLLGQLLTLSSTLTFTRAFAITQATGVPINNALQVINHLPSNEVFATAIRQLRIKVNEGKSIYEALSPLEIFPPFLIQMIHIGENSGRLEQMLKIVTQLYEEKLETTLSGLTTLIEPIMMLVLGVGVGGLVVAIYLPIFKMGTLF